MCQASQCLWPCDKDAYVCDGICVSDHEPTCCGADPTLDANADNAPDCQESIISGGQFKQDLGRWRQGSGTGSIAWSPLDARNSKTSGSVQLTVTAPKDAFAVAAAYPCLPAVPGRFFILTADYSIASGQAALGTADWDVVVFDHADCTGQQVSLFRGPIGTTVGTWSGLIFTFSPLPSSKSMRLQIYSSRDSDSGRFVVNWDNVVLR